MKNIIKLTKFLFTGYFSFIASLASIVGLLYVVFTDKDKTIIALVCLILFLLALLFIVFNFLNNSLKSNSENGFYKFATYVKYSTDDSKIINYELHKFIQCKSIIMDEHTHRYYWTGTKKPIISSEFQEFINTTEEGNGYVNAFFKFKTPLVFNQFGIVHIKMICDDSDQKSKTHVEQKINESVQLLNFRIELKYKKNNTTQSARILKKLIGSPKEFELIDTTIFDNKSKSYEYSLNYPLIGHIYKIEWDR